jgi:hypothetical protein
VLSACGSDSEDDAGDSGEGGPDTAAMSEAFEERSQAAYEAAGRNGDDALPRGIVVQECFVLDREGVMAVGEAAGAEGPSFRIADTNYLKGVPGAGVTLSCSLASSGAQIAVVAGTTTTEPEGRRRRVEGGGLISYRWVSDGLVVAVAGPEGLLGGEEGFAALSAAVENVERTLTSSSASS